MDSSTTVTIPSVGINVYTPASVEASLRRFNASVITLPSLFEAAWHVASSPTITNSADTYPVTVPDVILYHPSNVSSTVAAP